MPFVLRECGLQVHVATHEVNELLVANLGITISVDAPDDREDLLL